METEAPTLQTNTQPVVPTGLSPKGRAVVCSVFTVLTTGTTIIFRSINQSIFGGNPYVSHFTPRPSCSVLNNL